VTVVATLNEALQGSTDLSPEEIEWLHLVVGDWQLLSDLSFADLVLWARHTDDEWVSVAHVRPTTGQMVFYEDIVGWSSGVARRGMLSQAYHSGRVVRAADWDVNDELPVREEAIPVVKNGRALAVITRHTNAGGARTPSRLEVTYLALADFLAEMIASGEFPSASAPTGLRRGAPRVGDGVMHLDAEGMVVYASPNAVSAIHRLGHVGDVIGEVLAEVVADVVEKAEDPVDESLALVVTGRAPWRADVASRTASVSMRAIPLTRQGQRHGALILLRDVSELRRRERELLTKDATIREIHHRVKNNLQTVAALLRLQARRMPEGQSRTALEEAVRRVGAIALVHETLSQGFDETVNFDEIVVRSLKAVVEVATSEHTVESSVVGTFGRMRAEDATALAMIISELVQNAAEHGLADHGGRVAITATRVDVDGEGLLTVTITDDGAGLPAGFRPGLAGLGTRIVTSLVQDLRGRIRWESTRPHGTTVRFTAWLRPLGRDARPASTAY
jgi:two-component sensor histidine kinase